MKRMKKFLAVMLAAIMVMGMTTSVFADSDYMVTISDSDNGIVSADVDSANDGEKVTLTVTPYNGYELDTLTVTEETSGDAVTTTSTSSTIYTFTMPADNVTVSATFTKTATDSYVITIENETSDYTYLVYQIFTGTLSSDETTLSDIQWGSGINDDGKAALIAEYCPNNSSATASDVATAIVTANNAQSLAKLLAADSSYLTGETTMSYDSTTGTYSATGLAAGYYLVVNTAVPSTGTEVSYSNYIVQVVDDVTMSPKSDVPTLNKTVSDVNDSTGSTAQGDSDSADYDIGDTITYTLTATLPSDYANYAGYKLVFNDQMSSGLTFNASSVTVTVDGTALATTAYTVTPTTDTAGAAIAITISDLKTAAPSATSSSTVVVTYTATLTTSASYKETNSAYLTYSNNPNADSNSYGSDDNTGTTTTDLTAVFTYTLTINKVDEDDQPLSGAGFTLYKFDPDAGTAGEYVAVGNEITNVTTFTWSGLDDGQYKLSETTTPTGKNTMADVEFYIIATHTEDGVETLGVYSDAAGTTPLTGYTATASDGTITATITNYAGSTLPETGGIGTTMFYVVGMILVLGAAVVLVTRRRMAK